MPKIAPKLPAPPTAADEPEKRSRGRPVEAGAGPLKRVNLTLDEETLAIAERIAPGSTSRAVREAMRFWAKNNPA